MKNGKIGETLETIIIFIALISLLPIVIWWHIGSLHRHSAYFFYLFVILCVMGYVTYRRIKRIRSAFRSAKGRGSEYRFPPFFR